MKCPECGLWNRASMPHCIRCGAPLNIDGAGRPAWKDSLKDGAPGTKYLRADEFGQMDVTPDPRDALAREMQELKVRKQEGAALKERMIRPPRGKPGVVIESEAEYQTSLVEKYKEFRDKLTMCAPEEFDALYDQLAAEYAEAGYQAIAEERLAAYQAGNSTKMLNKEASEVAAD